MAAWASPPWECTHIQRRDGDFLLAQGWIAFEGLYGVRSYAPAYRDSEIEGRVKNPTFFVYWVASGE